MNQSPQDTLGNIIFVILLTFSLVLCAGIPSLDYEAAASASNGSNLQD